MGATVQLLRPTVGGGIAPTREQIAAWARRLEGQTPDEIIRFAVQQFRGRLAVATQFGVEGCSLLHRVSRIAPDAFIFSIDTGLLFEETLRLADRLERKLGIRVHRIRPDLSVGQQAVTHGPNLWERDPDLCCGIRKVVPMQRLLRDGGYGAWMTSVRRDQTLARRELPVVKWDERFGLVKFSPFAALSAAEIDAYNDEHDVPTNPLRLVGYQSLGCFTCTRPVAEDEDRRAGRWSFSSKTECGLHT